MNNVLLLKYNNYLNRVIKRESNIDAYRNFEHTIKPQINFNPNDGVNATLVFNVGDEYDEGGYDYLVVFDEYNQIKTRWYVIESSRLRNGQYRLKLKRDSVADFYDEIIGSPAFVEKGHISSVDDILIYNKENVTYNQIKQSETLLKDVTGVAWVVGYMAIDSGTNTINPIASLNVPVEVVTRIEDYQFYENSNLGGNVTRKYYTSKKNNLKITAREEYDYASHGQSIKTSYLASLSFTNTSYEINLISEVYKNYILQFSPELTESEYNGYDFRTRWLSWLCQNNRLQVMQAYDVQGYNSSSLENQIGKYIYDSSTGTTYKVTSVRQSQPATTTITHDKNSTIEGQINGPFIGKKWNGHTITLFDDETHANTSTEYTYVEETIVLSTVSLTGELYLEMSATSNVLQDAPFKMFAIPYGQVNVVTDITRMTTSAEKIKLLASSIAISLGTKLYDIQLLPYCPIENVLLSENTIDASSMVVGVDYDIIKDSNSDNAATIGYVFYPKTSNIHFSIDNQIEVPNNVEDFKVENETTFYRLCSPNYASSFEFKATMNKGISNFELDATYKPYNPYVKVNPMFGGLYGQDFNDYRGMICQGDFSLPVVNDEWKQYQINNKNYLNAFNREIDSMEYQRGFQRFGEVIGALTGGVSGAVSGSFLTGNAIGGAVMGGISTIGGLADIGISEALYQENLDLTKDRFNFNLGNISARPNTLAKIGSFDYNNKIFPVLEKYSCTDEEKNILRTKLKYEGYTINIATEHIYNYMSDEEAYLRATLIRCDTINCDYHLLNDIKRELQMGVRIKLGE